MQKLTEMDCSFLQQESVRTPMHISPVIIYDQSRRRGGKVSYQDILTLFARNLHKSTIFRRKLAGGAMGLDTPYWVEDSAFDLEFHLRHIALPRPGDWRQLCILLSRLHARGLDMKRPLWECYIIEGLSGVEGLPDDSFALMLKIHHAAIDGVSGAEIVTAIHSLTEELAPPPVEDDWEGEREPSPWFIWSRAYVNNLKRPFKFVGTAGNLVPAAIRAYRQRQARQADAPPAEPVKTRFNQWITPSRVTDTLVMELDDLKAIRKALDGEVTINDIVIAVVSGALRQYLHSKGELPAHSLSCGAPINTRAQSDSSATGNQVSIMMLGMASDIADPLQRLRTVHDNAAASKAIANTLGTGLITDLSEILMPQVMGWSLQAALLAANREGFPLPCHTIISNVPGPQFPVYLAGARVHMMMGIGPLLHMMGLFHAVISGAGKITINFVSTREMLPDPQFYRECLQASFTELYEAAVAPTRKRNQKKPRTTRTKRGN